MQRSYMNCSTNWPKNMSEVLPRRVNHPTKKTRLLKIEYNKRSERIYKYHQKFLQIYLEQKLYEMRTNTSAQIHQLFEPKKRGQLEARVAIRRKQGVQTHAQVTLDKFGSGKSRASKETVGR